MARNKSIAANNSGFPKIGLAVSIVEKSLEKGEPLLPDMKYPEPLRISVPQYTDLIQSKRRQRVFS